MSCGLSPRVDERFTAFADLSRRIVLSTLSERSSSDDSPTVAVETLAAELVEEGGGREGRADGGVSDLPGSFTDAKIELVHVHIPSLERAGLVETDDESVRLAVDAEVVEYGLELAEKFDPTD